MVVAHPIRIILHGVVPSCCASGYRPRCGCGAWRKHSTVGSHGTSFRPGPGPMKKEIICWGGVEQEIEVPPRSLPCQPMFWLCEGCGARVADDDRHHHDHPMDFISLILRGGYVEHRPGMPPRRCPPGSVVVRRAEDLHYLKLIAGSAWTLVLTTPRRRKWGFMTEDGWIEAGEYDAWKARYA